MNSLFSSAARAARSLLCTALVLAPGPALAQPKVEVAKDMPPERRAMLQLGVDAMMKDRGKKDYAAAQKKLKKAVAMCKEQHCPAQEQAQTEFFLGIVTAEAGDEKGAQALFEGALKVDPTLDASGGLSSPPVDRAFAAAKAKLPPPPAAAEPAPVVPAAPADSGFNQPSAQTGTAALSAVGGATYAPGLGFVQGADSSAGHAKAEGSPPVLTVPKLDQSSVWDNSHFRYNVGFSYSSYKFNSETAGQKKLGGTLIDIRLGDSLPLWDFFIPSIDLGISGGKFGDDTTLGLISGGNYELWNVNGDARAGIDLSVGWLQVGGYFGGFLNYYIPSLENLPGEPSNSGKDSGMLYGGRARIGSSVFLELSYTWKQGELITGRNRRIEFGSVEEDGGGWSLFWEAREQPKELAPGTASQRDRLIGGMPLNYSLGFCFRNY